MRIGVLYPHERRTADHNRAGGRHPAVDRVDVPNGSAPGAQPVLPPCMRTGEDCGSAR